MKRLPPEECEDCGGTGWRTPERAAVGDDDLERCDCDGQ